MERKDESPWRVYILECADGSFYIGCTNALEARIEAHNAGKGAKYTAGRRPVTVVYAEPADDRSAALKRELALKRLSRANKQKLIDAAVALSSNASRASQSKGRG